MQAPGHEAGPRGRWQMGTEHSKTFASFMFHDKVNAALRYARQTIFDSNTTHRI